MQDVGAILENTRVGLVITGWMSGFNLRLLVSLANPRDCNQDRGKKACSHSPQG